MSCCANTEYKEAGAGISWANNVCVRKFTLQARIACKAQQFPAPFSLPGHINRSQPNNPRTIQAAANRQISLTNAEEIL